MFKNKKVFITGGTGSFGKNMINFLLTKKTKEIIIYSRDEMKQWNLREKLGNLKNIKYITLHANSGEETIRAVVKTAKKINSSLKILLVTILTSISDSSLKKIGHTKPLKNLVKKQAQLAKKCGCHGIICAGTDLKFIKN